jgi:hypothetical protein
MPVLLVIANDWSSRINSTSRAVVSNTYKISSLDELDNGGDSPGPNSSMRSEIASAPVALPTWFQIFNDPEISGVPSFICVTRQPPSNSTAKFDSYDFCFKWCVVWSVTEGIGEGMAKSLVLAFTSGCW